LVAALVLPSLGPVCAPGPGPGDDTLRIGAFSVVREAFHEGLLPAFAAHWRRRTGRAVHFEESYNASGAQARAIVSGFDADVAILSLEGDMDLLVKANLVAKGWKDRPDRGMVARSLVVIGHRAGNPKGIRDWDDLARPGVGVLYPDPKTSGGARWNINAIYGAALRRPGADRAGARAALARIQANVVNMDASGRQSMATFTRGTGDAVVTYENEILLRRKMTGEDLPYAIPPSTLLIENPAAVVDDSVRRHGNRAAAEAFLAFLRSAEGQGILASYGFRSLTEPVPPGVFTMADLGGWGRIKNEVYDPGGVWDQVFTRRTGEE
jgi:sulfate transport system substrate-binding protein